METLEKLTLVSCAIYTARKISCSRRCRKWQRAPSSVELKEAFENHLEETETHVERLEQIFKDLEENPKGKTCHGMKGLIEEGLEILEEEGEDSVLDAGIIVAAQKVEHYEMAGYGSVRAFAQLLGQDDAFANHTGGRIESK